MNIIREYLGNVGGLELVKAQTPGGQFVFAYGETREEAIEKARWAEAEPA